MDRVSEIRFSGTWNQPKNGVLRQVEHVFFSFFAKFMACLMIFQSFAALSERSTLKYHQICQNFCQNWRKTFVQLALNSILNDTSKT